MHPNPAFRPDNRDETLELARDWGFGLLAMSVSDAAPMLSHIPFLLSEDGSAAELHLVRSNPIARALTGPTPARIALQGPHGYVSPDWYGIDGQVPTWNYLAIHLTGRLTPLPENDLPGLLDRLSAHFEARLAPKPEWTMAKMAPEAAAKMMRQVLPFRFHIDAVDSTWKLAQNKPDAARIAAADQIAARGMGSETRLLAALMRKPPE
ncbi:FMN-binding negative transcriptional regulator [Marimonas arenosa]|uniref:FMN-binding negative transcriptional regulator n=1 Tax=Marimonas arenosa TaxID=1795305 RepID=A0AAE3WDS1_9RHOB|nr:FMN-binding negative transcriptional regulator [Marimonas arenosa]MDQ2089890.1 FMN-binding negative transcriptional regulator [Marimonas arenosa]